MQSVFSKHLLYSVVTIGFERQLYSVEEQAMTVEVSILVLDGILARDVEVNILSSDGTARSESIMCTTSCLPVDQYYLWFHSIVWYQWSYCMVHLLLGA